MVGEKIILGSIRRSSDLKGVKLSFDSWGWLNG